MFFRVFFLIKLHWKNANFWRNFEILKYVSSTGISRELSLDIFYESQVLKHHQFLWETFQKSNDWNDCRDKTLSCPKENSTGITIPEKHSNTNTPYLSGLVREGMLDAISYRIWKKRLGGTTTDIVRLSVWRDIPKKIWMFRRCVLFRFWDKTVISIWNCQEKSLNITKINNHKT